MEGGRRRERWREGEMGERKKEKDSESEIEDRRERV